MPPASWARFIASTISGDAAGRGWQVDLSSGWLGWTTVHHR